MRASSTYDSNIAGGDETIEAMRDVQPSDVTFNLGASLAFQLPNPRRTLFLNVSADARRHANNKNLDGENFAITTGVANRFGLCEASAIASYARTQTLAENLTVAVTKNVVDQRSANTSLQCGRGGLTVSASGGVSNTKNDATAGGFIDSSSVQGALGIGYATSVLGNVSLTGQYSEASYDQPSSLAAALFSRGFRQYGGGVSFARKVTRRLNGTAEVAYVKIEPEGLGVASSGLNADVALNYVVSPRIGVAITYGLGNRASSTIDADYVRFESLGLTGSYQLNSRIGIQASLSAGRDTSKGGIQIGLPVVRKNEQYTLSGGASWRIGRNISASLNGAHTERTADSEQFNFKSDSVSVGLAASF